MEPWAKPSTSYIEAWVVQQRTRSWTPSGKIICLRGHSSLKTTSPNSYRIQYPQNWVTNTFKNNFISILAGIDPDFPLHQRDKLIPQACITINLLRNPHRNPQLSAEAHLNGNFDYNMSPLAPPGTKVVAFETPDKRNSWATHGRLGWYIGPALHHRRCWKIYVTKTAATWVCDTVRLFRKKFKMPIWSSDDTETRAALELTEALQNPHADLPYAPLSDNTITLLKEISDIFTNATITNPALTSSSHPNNTELPRVKTREAVEDTRVEEV